MAMGRETKMFTVSVKSSLLWITNRLRCVNKNVTNKHITLNKQAKNEKKKLVNPRRLNLFFYSFQSNP